MWGKQCMLFGSCASEFTSGQHVAGIQVIEYIKNIQKVQVQDIIWNLTVHVQVAVIG